MKVISTFFNLFFLAGAILLLIFTVLSGSSKHTPLNKFYWLEADTRSIPNAPASRSAWTFWGVCDKNDFGNCLLGPAYPLSPVDNFDTTNNIPEKFKSQQSTFYYLSRFAFAFCLIALGFAGLAFIIDLLGFCFVVIDKIVIFLVTIALFFMAGFASFQTAVVVLAKQAFHSDDRSASIGVKSMAIMWASFACLLICWVITLSANIVNSYKKHMKRVNGEKGGNQLQHPQQHQQQGSAGITRDDSSFTRAKNVDDENVNGGGIRFFKIKRNQKVTDEDSV
ncbi:SUR7 [Candida jiufengensis]|uniref:SUR7 n=1 Tax=Candida jiufengensis TaxID=497108 RepID=UPI0022250DC9|nr:SUR7 [Candida jiufengensis]KAI5956818.1 SUR7 [Candida jiufengensis]